MKKENIEEETKEEVEEEKPVEEKKKTGAWKNIALIVLSLVVLVLLFLLIDGKFVEKGNPEEKNKTEEKAKNKDKEKEKEQDKGNEKEEGKETDSKEDIKYEDISREDALVEEAYSLVPRGICGHAAFELSKEDRSLSDLSSKDKMEMLENHYRKYIPGATDEGKLYISLAEIKRYFENTSFVEDFVKNTPKDKRRVGLADEIEYKDEKLSMKHLYGTGCEGPSQGTMASLYSAKKENNKLLLNVIIYTKKATRMEDGSDGYSHFVFEIYRDEDEKEKGYEGYFEELDAAKENLDPSFFYGYQFIFDTADGNIRIKEIKYLDHLSDGI